MKLTVLLITCLTCYTLSGVSQTVYKTKNGKKYHQDKCSYLRSGSIPIEVSEALKRGLGACSVCAPPQESSKPPQQPNNPSAPRETPKQSPQSNRCNAITKAGLQCSRAPRSNGLCWQHGG